jgi:hypothetical protein
MGATHAEELKTNHLRLTLYHYRTEINLGLHIQQKTIEFSTVPGASSSGVAAVKISELTLLSKSPSCIIIGFWDGRNARRRQSQIRA